MRKSLGDKRKYLTDQHIADITRMYSDAVALDETDPRIKVFANEDFGYHRITIERPMRRRWHLTQVAIDLALASKPIQLGQDIDPIKVRAALQSLLDMVEETQAAFVKRVLNACTAQRQVGVAKPALKVIVDAAAVADPDAPLVVDARGRPVPDPDLRDNENVPLADDITAYVAREVLPHVPEAWVDEAKTKVGYEIPFTRHFYVHIPPRPIVEIDAELDSVEEEIQSVLGRLAR